MKPYYNATERCWYVPMTGAAASDKELRNGLGPVLIQLKTDALWITRLDPTAVRIDERTIDQIREGLDFARLKGWNG